jgi:hypothetical protein
MTFGGFMGNTDCIHYVYDGQEIWEQDGGCQGNWYPRAVGYHDMDYVGTRCEFYSQDNCEGVVLNRGSNPKCAAEDRFPHLSDHHEIRSFKCVSFVASNLSSNGMVTC